MSIKLWQLVNRYTVQNRRYQQFSIQHNRSQWMYWHQYKYDNRLQTRSIGLFHFMFHNIDLNLWNNERKSCLFLKCNKTLRLHHTELRLIYLAMGGHAWPTLKVWTRSVMWGDMVPSVRDCRLGQHHLSNPVALTQQSDSTQLVRAGPTLHTQTSPNWVILHSWY